MEGLGPSQGQSSRRGGFCVAHLIRRSRGHPRPAASRLIPVTGKRLSRHARSHGGDVAGRAVGGGAEALRDPGDQVACRAPPGPAFPRVCGGRSLAFGTLHSTGASNG